MNTETAVIDMELLALDLNSCTRCTDTLDHLEQAVETVRPVLEAMSAQVNVRKIVVDSEAQARRHRFVTSPTIRINGRDIALETVESDCDTCTDLCGCEGTVSCRVWRYRGEEYTEAPLGLIVEAVMTELFGASREHVDDTPEYGGVPENLQRFFRGRAGGEPAAQACCSPSEQAECCEPDDKAGCCGSAKPETCGCR